MIRKTGFYPSASVPRNFLKMWLAPMSIWCVATRPCKMNFELVMTGHDKCLHDNNQGLALMLIR